MLLLKLNYLCTAMVKIKRYPAIAVLMLIGIFSNSCKRNDVNNVPSLFTTGYWQLGSLTELRYLGDTPLSVKQDSCDKNQIFTFNKDNTCTYTNFACNTNSASGTWSLDDTRIFLRANITMPDSLGKPSQPFINAHINNLGDYSLVLETGDIQPYYNSTDTRVIYRWGFVRMRNNNTATQ